MGDSNRHSQDRTFGGRLWGFVRMSYPLPKHLVFTALLFLSLSLSLLTLSPLAQSWQVQPVLAIGFVTLFLLFFYFRVVDEIKDFKYDKLVNPERPLASGLVTHRDLLLFGILSLLPVVLLSRVVSPLAQFILALDIAWGTALIVLENRSRAVAEGPFLGLLVVYPVNILLSCYTLAILMADYRIDFEPRHAVLIAAFTLAFLHFEFARKTVSPPFGKPGEKIYAAYIGEKATLALSLLFAGLATLLLLILFRDLPSSIGGRVAYGLLVLPFLLASGNVALFLRKKQQGFRMAAGGVLFITSFYAVLLTQALVNRFT